MVTLKLKGLVRIKSKGHVYHYAWRGGPRLAGEPGTPEFVKSYNDAIAEARTPDSNRFRALVVNYKSSEDWRSLSEATKVNWSPWLDRISTHFGTLRLVHFDKPAIRQDIRQWRSKWADKPRSADYAVQVLSRVLAFGVENGLLAGNACKGIEAIYHSDRSEIIWTPEDITALKKVCPPEVANAVDLAAATGLRRGDLFKLTWSHIKLDRIEITTGKSRNKVAAIVPIYAELRDILASIPRKSPVVLTNSMGKPWSRSGFGSALNRPKKKAGLARLHFHDLRGTAATRFYLAGLNEQQIASILGWTEDSVRKIIRKYVSRNATVLQMIRAIDRAQK